MSDVRPRNRRSRKGIVERSLTICALSILLFASRVVSEAINGRVVEEGDRTQREEEDTKKLYRGGGGVNFFDAPFGDVNAKDVPSNNNNNNNNAGVSVAAFAPRRALQVSARAFRSFLLTKEFSLGISKPPFRAFRFVAFASEANDHSSRICIAEKRG